MGNVVGIPNIVSYKSGGFVFANRMGKLVSQVHHT